MHIDGFKIIEKLYKGKNAKLYRGIRLEDNQPVILKVTTEAFPSLYTLNAFRSEYKVATKLGHHPQIIRYFGLQRYKNRLILVEEDIGGIDLQQLIPVNGFDLSFFLEMAIALTEGLAHIHQMDIIHRDIKPQNIILNKEKNIIKYVDFGLATDIVQELEYDINYSQTENSLKYISPEQTGRMNRVVDYRTDFYSLGITFYQMLTGNLPFTSNEPLELVHCHIAKLPSAPHLLDAKIPVTVSAIIMKLLSKNAEDRYQSCEGLLYDLKKFLSDYQTNKTLSNFKIGLHDYSYKFILPHKLYGREQEVDILLKAFEKASHGPSELLAVAGYSGIGKSSLINELYKPITAKKGYFLSGKYDQLDNTAYSGISLAFQGLIRQILSNPNYQLEQWKTRIQLALGNNGQLVVDVIPELELLIGKQPSLQKLSGTENQNRFHLAFQNFISVFCQAEHPIVLCLDDIQWADMASLNLLNYILKDNQLKHLLVVVAYRDNEVDNSHPAISLINDLVRIGHPTKTIKLSTLSAAKVNEWIADSLHKTFSETISLAELVHQKTEGNPFFVKVFLQSLYRDKVIHFAFETGWRWNLEEIKQQQATDNVVSFMVHRIEQLDVKTKDILKLASCIGNRFDLKFISRLLEKEPLEIITYLESALKYGLISSNGTKYRFSHDRIQEAVYEILSKDEQDSYHFLIGQALKNEDLLANQDLLFECVNHLNKAKSLLKQKDHIHLANLNLDAAKKAKSAIAYAAARTYLVEGLNCIPQEKKWSLYFNITFLLYKELAEIEYLLGDFDKLKKIIDIVLPYAKSSLDIADIYNLLISQKTLNGNYTEAIEIGRIALTALQDNLPDTNLQLAFDKEYKQINEILKDKKIAELINSPSMNDERQQAIMRVLMGLGAAAFLSNQALLNVICAKMVNISLNYGHVAEACYGYVFYGVVICGLGHYQQGYEFGKLGCDLTEKLNDSLQRCHAIDVFVNAIQHWGESLKNVLPLCDEGFRIGLEVGDLQYAGYITYYKSLQVFYQGDPTLDIVDEYLNQLLQFANKTHNQLTHDIVIAVKLVTSNLAGRNSNSLNFDIEGISESGFIKKAKDNKSSLALAHYPILKAEALYLHNHYKEALETLEEAESYLEYLPGFFALTERNWYHSLTLTGLYDIASGEEKDKYLIQLEMNQKQMLIWADTYPANYYYRYLLVQAEIARIKSNDLDAIELYDQAIEAAEKDGFIQHQALANELAAKFWLAKNKKHYAKDFLKKSFVAYSQWGAKHKIEQLRNKYAFLIPNSTNESPQFNKVKIQSTPDSNLSAHTLPSFDLTSLMKLSQVISSEVNLDRLLIKIMDLLIKTTGARQGAFLFKREEVLLIQAEFLLTLENSNLNQIPFSQWQNGSHAIVEYVLRTKNVVLLENACEDKVFAQDNYIRKTQAKSILCMPIIQQGTLKSILYLENNLAPSVFTHSHKDLLTILASQMAISIENAQYFIEQLNSAKKLAEQMTRVQSVEEYKDKLQQSVTNICHELRSPLQGIIGNLGLMKNALGNLYDKFSSKWDEEVHEIFSEIAQYLQGISASASHQMDISNKVLTLSKLEAGKVELEDKIFQPQKTLQDILSIVKGNLNDKQNILVQFTDLDVNVKADEAKLKQVIINLINNAIKFTPHGDIIVTFDIDKTEKENYLLQFSIKDSGIGMTEEEQQRLFQRFSQANSAISNKFGGSGLGLSICKNLVELMGGSISVDSQKNIGTTFTFSIVAKKPSLQEIAKNEDDIQFDYDISKTNGYVPELAAQNEANIAEQNHSALRNVDKFSLNTASVLDMLFEATGTMGELIRNKDWSTTSLGAIESWPQSLKTAVSIILNSQHPMFVAWGSEQVFIYNDAYIQVLSLSKHPWALGQPFAQVWKEIWDVCGPIAARVFQEAKASFVDNVRLFMQRVGYLEETYFSFSYSPIRDETGRVKGLFCPSAETTAKILSERRLKTLSQLSSNTLQQKTIQSACVTAINSLADNLDDVPFALLYTCDIANKSFTLAKASGIREGLAKLSPLSINLNNDVLDDFFWPMADILSSKKSQILSVSSVEGLPLGLANQQILQAIALPVSIASRDNPIAILIAGINPCRKLDNDYLTFFDLIATQVATAIQNAKTYEEQKKRTEELAELDKAKTIFFSNISHEFRTPLTLMLGPISDSLKDKQNPLADIHRSRLTMVQRNTLRLQKLVNSLLDFSRIEAGRAQATFMPTDLAKITLELSSTFESLLQQAGIEFELNIQAISEAVYIDQDMWEKIILNLLSNAYKFTLSGKIAVSLQQLTGKVQLKVIDTGVGIPKHEIPHMFERFHRVEGTQGRSYEGSGIGLALIYELVKLHAGTIHIESEVGKGSCFIITIPLGKAHLPQDRIKEEIAQNTIGLFSNAYLEEAKQWHSQASYSNPTTPRKELAESKESTINTDNSLSFSIDLSSRVLLVDDNSDMQNYIKGIISPYWNVETANNGEEAYKIICNNPPNLIVSDVMMPKVDGFTLIKQVRNNAQIKDIPIILLSARAGEEARIEGLNKGADDYLVKTSFTAEELILRIKHHLSLSKNRVYLEGEVKKRTQELVKLNESLHDFMDKLCHEIRNPLHGISGIKEILLDEVNTLEKKLSNNSLLHTENTLLKPFIATMKEQINNIGECIEHQTAMMNEVILFSRLDSNQLKLTNVTFKPYETVLQCLELYKPIIDKKIIKIDLSQLAENLTIKVDQYYFQQIINNLLNYVFYTIDAYSSISFSYSIRNYEQSRENRITFILKIYDEKLKEVNFLALLNSPIQSRLHMGSHYSGSTGSDLLLCKKLAEKMGGEINLKTKSDANHLTFDFLCEHISLSENIPNLTITQHEKISTISSVHKQNASTKCALIVEDNLINQTLLKGLLRKYGFTSVIANDGREAIEKFNLQSFDIIFMDIAMPNMNGFEATRLIREKERQTNVSKNVTIIGLSAYAQQDKLEQARFVGMNDYITKPASADKIKTVLNKWFLLESAPYSEKTKTEELTVNKHTHENKNSPKPYPFFTKKSKEFIDSLLNKTVSSTKPAENSNKRVLVVEDNHINQTLLKSILKKQGYECVIAEDGQEAIEKFVPNHFDFILMDVTLPKLDGLAATQKIREKENELQVKHPIIIIGLSAHAQTDKLEAAYKAGMNDYIIKPASVEKIYAIIDKWVNPKVELASNSNIK